MLRIDRNGNVKRCLGKFVWFLNEIANSMANAIIRSGWRLSLRRERVRQGITAFKYYLPQAL